MAKIEGTNVRRGPWEGIPPSGGDGDGTSDMNSERIGRLEGAFEGLRHSQNMLLGAVIGIGAILTALGVAYGVYSIQRMDHLDEKISALSDRVGDLPDKINGGLRDITKTLADSITAAKQQPPQVLLIPAPQPQAPNTSPKAR